MVYVFSLFFCITESYLQTEMGNITPRSLSALPVWAVTDLVAHPVQDILYERLTKEHGVFMFWGPWSSGKQHYMLDAARRMRNTCKNRDVHWVPCGSREYGDAMMPWLARMVLGEGVESGIGFVSALPRTRAVTIFLEHSELLFIDKKASAVQFLAVLAGAIDLSLRTDVNVIFSNSRPENAQAVLVASESIRLLGSPECSRWHEPHVRAFMDQQHAKIASWTNEERETLLKLGSMAGTVGFVQQLVYSDPKRLKNKQCFAEKEARRWDALTVLRV
jgi:hypothetical protein